MGIDVVFFNCVVLWVSDTIIPFVSVSMMQVLSMSRLGGAAAVAPLVADMSPEVLQQK